MITFVVQYEYIDRFFIVTRLYFFMETIANHDFIKTIQLFESSRSNLVDSLIFDVDGHVRVIKCRRIEYISIY